MIKVTCTIGLMSLALFATAQDIIKPQQYVETIPGPADNDESDPEYGLWLRGMMDFECSNIVSSSHLSASAKNSYSVKNLSDDNPNTAWVEGKEDYGIGEYLEFNYGNTELWIYNGYQKSLDAFYNNSRVKAFKIYFDGKFVATVILNDKPNGQKIDLTALVEKHGEPSQLKFEIKSVYEGKKWKDTAISEMYFTGG